ncbi:MAG: hypothetical protein ACEPOW_13730 [Bacteroidales bacterium]
MSDFKKQFILKSKSGFDELIKVLDAPIDNNDTVSNLENKKALQTKRKTFVEAKSIIKGILELDYNQQAWARKSVESLITSGKSSIELLIDTLDDKIKNVDKIAKNAGDVANAVESKILAFNDAYVIMTHIDELERIVSEDEIVLKDTEFNEGYCEIYADKYTEWGDSKGFSQKAGYDPDLDAVKICPNGTVGEIIVIEGLRIALPKPPPKTKTLFNDKKKKDQYWRRQAPPRTLGKKTAKAHESFIHDEFKRKREGIWFMNNGKQEYVTGAHWFVMNHCRTGADGFYYHFTKAQQKLLIYAEACWCDERSYGMIFEKIRRFGATDCLSGMGLCKSITVRKAIAGMTSKKDSDAKKNFIRQTYMFANLPFYFKPICRDERPKASLEFMSPSSRTSKTNKDKEIQDNSLETIINYESTTEDSYDGDEVLFYLGDEFSKWKKQNGNTISHLEMIQKSITKGIRITGKIFLISTVEQYTGKDPDEDDDALAGDRYKKIYYNSIPTERDGNGQTLSGLYKIFVSVLEHYEGLIDIYGYPIVEDPPKPIKTFNGGLAAKGIRTILENKLAAFKGNARARIEFLRKTPMREEDGFAVKDGNCIFNQGNIVDQLSFIDSLLKNKHGLPGELRRGNFEWKDGIKDCGKVLWRDDPNGRFLISWMPSESLQNKVILKGKRKFPGNPDIGAFGIDDYRVTKAADGKGSKGSLHGYAKENTHGPSHTFFLEYLCRPKDKPTFRDDMIMAMVFYGIPALIENNVDDLLKEMHRRGYSGYSIRRPDKSKRKLSTDEEMYGGIPAQNESVRELQSTALEFYIEHRIGEIDDQEYGQMYFVKTLLDWIAFDPKNRTKRDASISSSLAIIGATRGVKKSSSTAEERKELLQGVTGRFDNTGVRARAIVKPMDEQAVRKKINPSSRRSAGRYNNRPGRFKK